MYKIAQASIEVYDRMLEDAGIDSDFITHELARRLANHIAKEAGFSISRDFGCQYNRTRFTSKAIVFLNKKDLEQYVKQQAKKMIENGSVA